MVREVQKGVTSRQIDQAAKAIVDNPLQPLDGCRARFLHGFSLTWIS